MTSTCSPLGNAACSLQNLNASSLSLNPFQAPASSLSAPGSYWAINTAEYKVEVVVSSVFSESLGKNATVVSAITMCCGTGAAKTTQTYTAASFADNSDLNVFYCCPNAQITSSTCAGQLAIGHTTITPQTFPVQNIQVHEIQYAGSNGISGLCYEENAGCKDVSNVAECGACGECTSGNSTCSPVVNESCSLANDDKSSLTLDAFGASSVDFSTPGSYWALNTEDYKVEVVVSSVFSESLGKNATVVTSVTMCCGTGAAKTTQTYTADSFANNSGLNAFYCCPNAESDASLCNGQPAIGHTTIQPQTFPVQNIQVHQIQYSGSSGISGLCFRENAGCKDASNVAKCGECGECASTAKPILPGHSTCAPVATESCSLSNDDKSSLTLDAFGAGSVDFTTPGSYWALNTKDYKVAVVVSSEFSKSLGKNATVVSAITMCCGTGAAKTTQTYTAASFANNSGLNAFYCCPNAEVDASLCNGQRAVGHMTIQPQTFPVQNIQVQEIQYSGLNGISGLCFRENAGCKDASNVPQCGDCAKCA
ncbi:hypothetical protein HDU98_009063 [Podochytrium sp. JEL0797]|nr:hypothetical protein HDU98_009063 [Podochytrium sp. JEL0797]